jgi:outer membrane protein assembly factor BamB
MRDHVARPRRLARVAGLTLLVLAVAGCWPARAQGPDRRAHNPFESGITAANVTSLKPVWTTATTGWTAGTAVVGDTTVHVPIGGNLTTFDKATGQRLWRYPDYEYAPQFMEAVADGDRVLMTLGQLQGTGGAFYREAAWFDARTGGDRQDVATGILVGRRGTTLGSFSLGGGALAPFSFYGLAARDEADGRTRLGVTVSVSGWAARPPTLGAARMYHVGPVTTSYVPGGSVTGVHAFALDVAPTICAQPPPEYPSLPRVACATWSTPTAAAPATSPVVGPGEEVVYVALDDGTLLAVDAADGHVRWQAALGAAPSADPALADGTLYVPLVDGDLVAVPAGGCGGAPGATCPVAWRADVGGAGVQPAVAGGLVFVGTDAGRLVAVRAGGCGGPTCRPVHRRALGAAVTGAPAVTGGRVYVGLATGAVVALAPTRRP